MPPGHAPCMIGAEGQNLSMQTTNDIRSAFLDYFARHEHEIVPSSPLVPRNDPTLLFTNAGEDVLELHHAGIGEQQCRIVSRHERARRHDLVLVAREIVEKG